MYYICSCDYNLQSVYLHFMKVIFSKKKHTCLFHCLRECSDHYLQYGSKTYLTKNFGTTGIFTQTFLFQRVFRSLRLSFVRIEIYLRYLTTVYNDFDHRQVINFLHLRTSADTTYIFYITIFNIIILILFIFLIINLFFYYIYLYLNHGL